MSAIVDPRGGVTGALPVSVFGASGRLGRHVVAELLQQGHAVVAFVHSNNPFDARLGLRIVYGDVHDRVAVSDALAGNRGVIATLGSAAADVKDVSSAGTRNIAAGMTEHAIARIVSITGSAARDDPEAGAEHPHLLARRTTMLGFNPELLLDGEVHLRLLRRSGLDWTVVRAPRMTDMGPPAAAILSEQPPDPSTVLAYRAVARAIVTEFLASEWRHAAPFVSPK